MLARVITSIMLVVAGAMITAHAQAQSQTVFSGVPVVKVNEGGIERLSEDLSREKAVNLGCVISEIGGKYYWATRENKEMVRRVSGAFITFLAVDGSGYVRILDPGAKSAVSLISPTEAKFDYVEHLSVGLRSITYYGNAR